MTELRFPKLPLYEGWGKPMRVESDIAPLVLLEGTPPPGLEGTMYKVGPDRQFPPMHGDDVFIDGEGMVHMFRFADGAVSYRSRWVRSARFEAQEKAGRSLFAGYRDTFHKDPEAEAVHGGTANTNAVMCRDKLLILKEDDLPYALDADTLETLGRFDYDGQVTAQRLSAHPKLDPVANTVLNFGNQIDGDGTLGVAFYEFDADGKVIDEIRFDAPFAGQVHDFAFTEDYVVFAFFPLVTDLEAVKRTGRFFQWRPQHGMKIAILKRHGSVEDIRWFDGPAISFGHTVNAFQDGTIINFDIMMSEGNWISFYFPEEGKEPSMPGPQRVRRIKIDLARNDRDYKVEPDFGIIAELGRIDDRYLGHDYRYIWQLVMPHHNPQDTSEGPKNKGAMAGVSQDAVEFIDVFNGAADVGCIDLKTGKVDSYSFGPETNIHEPQFVPRASDSPEGDGWLLVVVNRLRENRSGLAIMNALDLKAGPVALYDLGVRIRSTFHGTWVPAETFKTYRYDMSRVRVPAR